MKFYPIEFSQWRICWVRQDTRGRRSRRARRAIRAAKAGQMSRAFWLLNRRRGIALDAAPQLALVEGHVVRFTESMRQLCAPQLDGEWVIVGFIFGDFPRVEMDYWPRRRRYTTTEPELIVAGFGAGRPHRDCFRRLGRGPL